MMGMPASFPGENLLALLLFKGEVVFLARKFPDFAKLLCRKAKALLPSQRASSDGGARAAASASTRGSGRAGDGRLREERSFGQTSRRARAFASPLSRIRGLDPSMPAVSLLKMYFLIGTAFGVLLALYGLVDSVGGLMFVPTRHHMEVEWAVKDAPAAAAAAPAPARTTAKKHIGQR
ncbi:hypothetical protein SRHO_G00088900 [Serrasalmus rhombeus]